MTIRIQSLGFAIGLLILVAFTLYHGNQLPGGLAESVSSAHTGRPVFFTLFFLLLPPLTFVSVMFIYFLTDGFGWKLPQIVWIVLWAFFGLSVVLFIIARN